VAVQVCTPPHRSSTMSLPPYVVIRLGRSTAVAERGEEPFDAGDLDPANSHEHVPSATNITFDDIGRMRTAA
jgi:hypothetical protein